MIGIGTRESVLMNCLEEPKGKKDLEIFEEVLCLVIQIVFVKIDR